MSTAVCNANGIDFYAIVSPSFAIVTDRTTTPTSISLQSAPAMAVSSPSLLYPSSCPCESHLARTFADQVLPFSIDTLFELLFGDNAFARAYHDSQKLIGNPCTSHMDQTGFSSRRLHRWRMASEQRHGQTRTAGELQNDRSIDHGHELRHLYGEASKCYT